MHNCPRKGARRAAVTAAVFSLALMFALPARAFAETPPDLGIGPDDTPAVATDAVRPSDSKAGDDIYNHCDPGTLMENDNVAVCFASYGDHLWVKDKQADGRSAFIEAYVSIGGRHETCREKDGAGSFGQCNYNFTEGAVVSFHGFSRDTEGHINIEQNHTEWKSTCSSSGCGTTIPSGYDYHPHSGPQVTLHDYCTHGPDQPTLDFSIGPVHYTALQVDFRGACARHDMCYENHTADHKDACDSEFKTYMYNQCDYTYQQAEGLTSIAHGARLACHGVAKAFYEVVHQFGDG